MESSEKVWIRPNQLTPAFLWNDGTRRVPDWLRCGKDDRRICGWFFAPKCIQNTLAGLSDIWSGDKRCLWMHIFMAVPMTPSAAEDMTGLEWCSFGVLEGFRELWSRCVSCPVDGSNDTTGVAAISDFGSGDIAIFVLFNFLLLLAVPHLHGVPVYSTWPAKIGICRHNSFKPGMPATLFKDFQREVWIASMDTMRWIEVFVFH